MRKLPALGVAAVTIMALAGCTGDGGGGSTASPTGTATTTETEEDKVYSEDELRDLISGTKDGDGNELKLYSKDQVDQGQNIANILMNTATVDPEECKDIASAGLQDTVENGDVAVAISESEQPRTLSAQSGSEGPDAVELLNELSGKLDQCSTFKVEVLGQSYEVTTEEVQADTDAEETFGTVSTRTGAEHEMLMQVSGAEGRLLVVATKSGADLGDEDQKELEDLINEVLEKADDGGTATSSPTSTSTSGTGGTESPSESPSPTMTESDSPTSSPTSTTN
ncbi:hypothetical protein V1639_08235 [Pseudarthrobacter sp. J75]|uniref:hypothetical protein n=1 Tax=unclassified Pseudarthrobacter TaxID=2647000 RepID=UPI002E822F87|nr:MULTISPECIES: hypothetical protein [unclassified Pseudarthrobacter]MEE2522093.1 hypothetical protein [Pseudarthrobacter sp. J47]MEE2529018.1 hypothetical protein [Pseudarthrobacter sp. J75]MEE2570650.1 hypothetical protein [Pseudarthrobacter sp. J64]